MSSRDLCMDDPSPLRGLLCPSFTSSSYMLTLLHILMCTACSVQMQAQLPSVDKLPQTSACREDLKTHLQAQNKLMEQLADPKLLSKAFIVSCGSRAEDGLLRDMAGMGTTLAGKLALSASGSGERRT